MRDIYYYYYKESKVGKVDFNARITIIMLMVMMIIIIIITKSYRLQVDI